MNEGGIKHNSEQRQRPTARLSTNRDKLYPEGGCRERHTHIQIRLMDRFWRLHFTLRYDSCSILFTSWRVKRPGSAEVETCILGGSHWRGGGATFLCGRQRENREGPNTQTITLQAPFVRGARANVLKRCLDDTQSRGGTNTNVAAAVVGQGPPAPQSGHIIDWAGTQDGLRKLCSKASSMKGRELGGWLSAMICRLRRGRCWLAAFLHILFQLVPRECCPPRKQR